ncbi:hypothetical protein BS78_02G219800 [Paspalum vaginatum]|nr:hypothetical protein BS78_02G219800 [Paspalum vaginatum]
MACLLVLVVAATLLMAPPGKLTHAARTTSPAEDFWRTALPGAPMPEAIRELLRPAAPLGTRTTNAPNDDDDPPIPPMNFKYDDYRSSRRRHHAADAAPSRDVLLNKRVAVSARRSDAAAVFFFLEEAVRVGEALPFRTVPTDDVDDDAPAAWPPLQLYTVRAVRAVDGCRFVVCRRREAGPRDGGAVYGCRATGPARAYVADVAAGESRETVAAAVVVCHADDTSPWGPARAAFRLLDVKPGDAAVCHALLGAEVLPVKEDERRPSSA